MLPASRRLNAQLWLAAMNAVDVLILAAFVVIAGVGYYAGVARMASLLVAGYFATVIAATFYERFGDGIKSAIVRISTGAAYFTAFTLLFVIMTILFTFIILTTTHPISTKRRFAIFDTLGGVTISIVVAFVSITLALAITAVMLQAATAAAGSSEGGLMGMVRGQVEGSSLAPLFFDLLPYVTTAVRPWFPSGLPPILSEASA